MFADPTSYRLPIPDRKPHTGESLWPWLASSAVLIGVLLCVLTFIYKPAMPTIYNQSNAAIKTFHVMPLPKNVARPPSIIKHVAAPHPHYVSQPLQPAIRNAITSPSKMAIQMPILRHPAIHRTERHPLVNPLRHPAIKTVSHPITYQEVGHPLVNPIAAQPLTNISTHSPRINLGRLYGQMNKAAREATSSPPLPKFKNPGGPVASFYIDGWIQKLERIGDLNYSGSKTGLVRVKVVLNKYGVPDRIVMVRPSTHKRLNADAERIIRLSLPYTPFSRQLASQTHRIDIIVRIHFVRSHNVNAWG